MTELSQESRVPLSVTLISGENEAAPDPGVYDTEWRRAMQARVTAELPGIIAHFEEHGHPRTSVTIHDRSMPAPDDDQVI